MRRRRTTLIASGVVLALVVAVLLRWVFVPYRISGSSMEPTLVGGSLEGREGSAAGDIVLVGRLVYRLASVERFDIVVVDRAVGHESVKRVVGLPGEMVEIRNGKLWVDGVAVELPIPLERETLVSKGQFGRGPVALGAADVFVLGDAGYLSEDSRAWGPIPLDQLRGKVLWRLAPWSRFGRVR